jgi:cysteinyl-tRNA synthetase
MQLQSTAALLGFDLLAGFKARLAEVTASISDDLRSDIDARVAERTAAKQARDFAAADRIRDELKAEGILLEDGPGGTTWRRA